MVVRDTVYRPADLPAFVAVDDPDLIGLVTYELGIDSWHVLSLDSLVPGHGLGGALLDRVEGAARTAGSPRITLVTTNDNVDAIGFYQRRGYRIASIDPGAVDRAARPASSPSARSRSAPRRESCPVANLRVHRSKLRSSMPRLRSPGPRFCGALKGLDWAPTRVLRTFVRGALGPVLLG